MAFTWYSIAVAERAKRKGIQVGFVEIRDAQTAVDRGRGQTAEGDDAPHREEGSPDHWEAVSGCGAQE
jgi:hypothetical protein